MTIKNALMFWMVCDSPGCTVEDSDPDGLAVFSTAAECIEVKTHDYGGWVERDGKHYCEEHQW